MSPRHGRIRNRAVAAVVSASALLLVLLGPVPAGAAPICVFDGPTATVTIDVGNGETATIGRTGDAITLDGVPCDVATVTTVDAIVVNGAGIPLEVAIDLSGGPFAPGLTPEADGGDPEIEFTIDLPAGSPLLRIAGSEGPDHIVTGTGGINLDASEAVGDSDVLIVGNPSVVVQGGAGDDVLSVRGSAATGGPSAARLEGGADDDLLLAASGGNAMDGADGRDTVDYGAAIQLVEANLSTGLVTHAGVETDQVSGVEDLVGSPGDDLIVGNGDANLLRGGPGDDVLVGGAGDDTLDGEGGLDTVDLSSAPGPVTVILPARTATGDGQDTLAGIENAIGSADDDLLIGDDGANVLDGNDGDDRIDGGDGDDTLDGGPGDDTVEFGLSSTGVVVKLGKGTAEGAGDDTLANFENVRGTDKADTLHGDGGPNTLAGGRGADDIRGRGGRDVLKGGHGRDRLFGQKGGDSLFGGPGNDQLDGGRQRDFCHGGTDADSFVFCEVIKLG